MMDYNFERWMASLGYTQAQFKELNAYSMYIIRLAVNNNLICPQMMNTQLRQVLRGLECKLGISNIALYAKPELSGTTMSIINMLIRTRTDQMLLSFVVEMWGNDYKRIFVYAVLELFDVWDVLTDDIVKYLFDKYKPTYKSTYRNIDTRAMMEKDIKQYLNNIKRDPWEMMSDNGPHKPIFPL